ncbi:MAG: MbnP family protein [Flavobacteriales bacterium]
MTTLNRNFVLLLVAAISLLSSSCKKDDPTGPFAVVSPNAPGVTLNIEHHIDDAPLFYDTIRYTNAMGHSFSVSRLEYYLSEITLLGTNGSQNIILQGPFYINGTAGNSFDLGTLPEGEFAGATAFLGLTPAMNLTDSLPNTIENINMAWPVPMGGGYHFMKFEGHFLDNGTSTGYAMHIGRNENLPICTMPDAFTVANGGEIVLRFNLNQVFREPNIYDLSTGNYSMGSMMLMGQLRDNCSNAFNIQYRP